MLIDGYHTGESPWRGELRAVGKESFWVTRRYVPDAGNIVWLHFDRQAGHEQAGYRPAVVLSPGLYNERTGLLLCCLMTTQIKGYPLRAEGRHQHGMQRVDGDCARCRCW